ncbi:oxidoreductase [Marinagarivorans algicola]|uniref:oxidoreductase n=1 Tax=Marinagarivorans algicola TaxID=1513270 RepID=UPI0006B8B023|nr:oxidoreductase [Marinagarivorans algicola]
MELKDKRILVVGAGGLLGTSLVAKIMESGGEVVAADIDTSSLASRLKSIGVDVTQQALRLTTVDVTNEESVLALFDTVGDIDGAVNCTYPRSKSYGKHFFDVKLEDFNENVTLHLGSAFLFMQQCAVYFNKKKTPFSLVNISSIYGVVTPKFDVYEGTLMTMPVEYAAIKSAIIHLNKYVAKYVKDSRFRVNSVSPGGIYDSQPEVFCERYKSYTNGAGMLSVGSVLGAVSFLLGDGSTYMTGQNLVVDDGYCM